MKRKIAVILTLVLVVTAITASAVFAKENVEPAEKAAIKSMFDAMRSWAQQAQDNGDITKEEAKEWENHFKDMEKFHEKNGFGGMMGNGMMGNYYDNTL